MTDHVPQTLWLPAGLLCLLVIALLIGGARFLRRRGRHTGHVETSDPSGPPDAESLKQGYEVQDASAPAAGTVLVVIAGIAGSAAMVVLGLTSLFNARDDASRPVLTQQQQAKIQPPAPNLQSDPFSDINRLHAREQAALTGYAWANPDHHAARIPIDRAMALAAGRSLDPKGGVPTGGQP